jgi:gametolysin peptidase M11/alpha-galactosidase-like protein
MKDASISYQELTLRALGLFVAVLISASAIQAAFAETAEEMDVTINGKLKIVQIDHDPGTIKPDEVRYLLEDEETHTTFTLHFDKKAPRHLRSGMKLTARGRSKGQELLLAADGDGSQNITVNAVPTSTVAGDQKTLVIMANLTDASVTCSAESIRDLMFNGPTSSVDGLYRETSWNAVSFGGQVVGPYVLGDVISSCNFSAWADAADAAAQADGIDLAAYPRKVYVMPRGCSISGLADVGTSPSRTWIFRCDFPDVFAHELGHNLGMRHASTPTSIYGDNSDVMGGTGRPLRQINAPHREAMGWLSPQDLIPVTQDGTYTIGPLEVNPLDSALASALKVFKTDTNEYYYVSYRAPIGFDANTDTAFYHDRTSVHRWDGANATYLVALLADGENFVDLVNGITISQNSHSADRASVQLHFDPACRPALPAVSLAPSSQNANPGGTVEYTVSVTNSDGVHCLQSTFDLRHSVPFGWAGNVVPASVTLLPGSTGSATLAVTSPVGILAGNYSVAVDVADASQASRTASGSGVYNVVVQVDLTSPTAPSALTATVRRKGGVSLGWNPSQDNVAVSGYRVFRNGLMIGITGSLSYIDASASAGVTYSYFIKAFDAAENLSNASNTASVGVSGGSSTGSGGGKGGSKS